MDVGGAVDLGGCVMITLTEPLCLECCGLPPLLSGCLECPGSSLYIGLSAFLLRNSTKSSELGTRLDPSVLSSQDDLVGLPLPVKWQRT